MSTKTGLSRAAAVLMLGTAAAALCACQKTEAGAAAGNAAGAPQDAKSFIAKAETDLATEGEYDNRANWVQNNFITDDTNFLVAKADAEQNSMATRYAKDAARFDKADTDPVTKRKLELLKRALTLPAPDRPGAAEELAKLSSKLTSEYSTGKISFKGKTITLDDAEDLMRTSRNPADLKILWEGWHAISPPMKNDYAQLVSLANEGSKELGYKDTGVLWRSWYDMDPDAFAAKMDQLWTQVKPFYDNLHCYVRGRLNETYGDAVQPKTGPIRADLTGNMWAQSWSNIYDVVAPKGMKSSYSLDNLLTSHKYDAVKLTQTAEGFYTSLGFPPLPDTFWQRSLLERPRDREVVCHASAWDIDDKNDIRVKACLRMNADDFYTIHHELGHNFYQRAYAGQPYLFKNGANDGFHEAIGDFAGLNAVTPTYLKQIGLLDTVPGANEDIPFLLNMALDKIAFLPFGLLIDKWRWGVFSGEITPEHYNDAWWDLRTKYQGVAPPAPRPADAFDPGAKFHIPNSTPYARYFLAFVYEFQFYRAACHQAGWQGPLNRCSVFGNKEVGAKFAAMLEKGESQPWTKTLAEFTGENDIDASAIADYFAPLNAWLAEQSKGQACGW